MSQHHSLYNKNAQCIIHLSRLFLRMELQAKIPTFDELSREIGVARGTVQNSMRELQEQNAIHVHPRGYLGSFLVYKNIPTLLLTANIQSFLGAMSLPYSKIYEGLATGLILSMKKTYNIPINIAYMKDAVTRINSMLEGHVDFVVLSRNSAKKAIKKGLPLTIAIDFGIGSYLSAYLMVFANAKNKCIEDGMKVGIAYDSKTHVFWTNRSCLGKKVTFIEMNFDAILPALKENKIDVALYHKDNVNTPSLQMNSFSIDEGHDDSAAVLLVDSRRPELIQIFKEIIDVQLVCDTQKKVVNGDLAPQY